MDEQEQGRADLVKWARKAGYNEAAAEDAADRILRAGNYPQRVAALEVALNKTWSHNYGASHVRCGLCLATAMHDEANIEHKPGCIVLTLPKENANERD